MKENFNDWFIRKQKEKQKVPIILILFTIPGINLLVWVIAIICYFKYRKEE